MFYKDTSTITYFKHYIIIFSSWLSCYRVLLRNFVLKRLSIIQIRGRVLSGRITWLKRSQKKLMFERASVVDSFYNFYNMIPAAISQLPVYEKMSNQHSILKEFCFLLPRHNTLEHYLLATLGCLSFNVNFMIRCIF